MKLNNLFLLGATSLLVATVPISSYAEGIKGNSTNLNQPIILAQT